MILELPEIQIPAAFEVLRRPKRIKVFFGGRGSAKSESIGRQILINAEESEKGYKVLCGREFQNSIEDSVLGMLDEFIDQYEFQGFDVQRNVIYCPNEGAIKFQGLARNLTSVKSKHGYDLFWVEEAENVSQRTWDVIIPTLRKGGSELWVSFNPADEMDATYQEFVAPYLDVIKEQGFYEDDYIYVGLVNYDDNPFFPKELRDHSEKLKKESYKKWLHVYGGEPNMDYADSIIEPEWFDAAVDAHIKLNIKPRGERVTAFDVADEGKDAKALVSRKGILIDHVDQWWDGDVSDGIDKAFDHADDYRSDDLVYDNVGNGASVKVHLKKCVIREGMTVTGFGGGDGVDMPDEPYKEDRLNRDMFKNKRAQYWWYLRDRFEATYRAVEKGEYGIDPDSLISISSEIKYLAELKSELVKVQRKRTPGSRLVQIVSKEEMRKQGIPSPNMGDGVVMVFANPPKSNYVYVPREATSWKS